MVSSKFTPSPSPPPQLEYITLGPLVVPRIWVGLWQLSSPAWGTAPAARIRKEMARHVKEGFTAFADHYGSAELFFGQFHAALPPQVASTVVGATKWCVFKPTPGISDMSGVRAALRERMERMKTDKLDLIQVHWQDYSDKSYLDALHNLADLQSSFRKGRGGIEIDAIGLVNFDAIRLDEICTDLGEGVIVSNQVQFSLIDTRPLDGMGDVCMKHGVKLLTYGTLCGGFLSDKWLNQPEPNTGCYDAMTPSQRKYLDVILGVWGDWALFQCLLQTLRMIGDRRGGLSIANVGTRWVLDHPFVGAVIIGARLGVSEHTSDNQVVFGWHLSDDEFEEIEEVLDRSKGRQMIGTMGDCGGEYRL